MAKAASNSKGPTLVVMAAGMGSRYGGLKQIDPVGPNGEWIMDYSIYDAISAGCKKVVFIIRKEFEDAFRARIEKTIRGRVDIAYVRQELDSLVPKELIPSERQKPWGTGHAVLVARPVIDRPFAVINADDYYGPSTYKMVTDILDGLAKTDGSQHILIGYLLRSTLSEYGGVTRGICECDPNGWLISIQEMKGIERHGNDAIIRNNGSTIPISGDKIVSMNFWGFHPKIFDELQRQFESFIKAGLDASREFLLPNVINTLVQERRIAVKVITTNETWFGVTYKQDKDATVERIRELIRKGRYPQKLWS